VEEAKHSHKHAAFLLVFLLVGLCVGQESKSPLPRAQSTPAASGTAVSAGDVEKPLIYFYRIKQFAGSALEPSVYCDDKELARMDNGRYFGVTLDPGTHTCRMGDKQTGFEIDMRPGGTYYAKITIDVGLIKGHGRLTLMQKEQGAFELKKAKPLEANKVKDRVLVTIYDDTQRKP